MTDRLDELLTLAREAKARAEKATEGPWTIGVSWDSSCGGWPVMRLRDMKSKSMATLCDEAWCNAEFVEHARTDQPALADAVIELVAELRKLTEPRGGWELVVDDRRGKP